MFTGIIEAVEPVQSNTSSPAGRRLCVPLGKIAEGVKPGDSICVNGVCLTVSEIKQGIATFDVMAETVRASTIEQWKAGELVNLEQALAADGRFGGHIVQGHVDCVGTIKRVEKGKAQYVLFIGADADFMEHVIRKGSVAIDGVSLTIAKLKSSAFEVEVIPISLNNSNLGHLKPGTTVNIECDIIGKYVYNWISRIKR